MIWNLQGCSVKSSVSANQYPKYYNWVNDFENVIDNSTEESLNRFLENTKKEKDVYIAVKTLKFNSKIDADSFSNYTLRLAREWKIGNEKGRGVLVAFCVSQRLWRVQLTDDISELVSPDEIKQLFSENIRSYFKTFNVSLGINEFTEANVNLILTKTVELD